MISTLNLCVAAALRNFIHWFSIYFHEKKNRWQISRISNFRWNCWLSKKKNQIQFSFQNVEHVSMYPRKSPCRMPTNWITYICLPSNYDWNECCQKGEINQKISVKGNSHSTWDEIRIYVYNVSERFVSGKEFRL